MTKVDLQSGMVIELRNGDKYVIIDDRIFSDVFYGQLEPYSDNLKFNEDGYYGDNRPNSNLDIMKVYKSHNHSLESMFDICGLVLLWERCEIKWPTRLEAVEKILPNIQFRESGHPYTCFSRLTGVEEECNKIGCGDCWNKQITKEELELLNLTLEDFKEEK